MMPQMMQRPIDQMDDLEMDALYDSVVEEAEAPAPPLKKRRQKRPFSNLQELAEDVLRLETLYRERNRRIERNRLLARLWRLSVNNSRPKFTNATNDDMPTFMSLPDTIIRSMITPIAQARHVLTIPAEDVTDEARETSDAQEDLCRHFWQRANERFTLGGGSNTLMWAFARPAVEEGFLYGRVIANPDDKDCPPRIMIFDTLEMLPEFDEGEAVRYVYRVYSTTVRHLRQDLGDTLVNRLLRDSPGDEQVRVCAIYTEDEHGIALLDHMEWLKPMAPHNLGENPIFCAHFLGWTSQNVVQSGIQLEDREADRGRGALEAVDDELMRLADAVSQRLRLLEWAASPPILEKIARGSRGASGEIAPNGRVQTDAGNELTFLNMVPVNLTSIDSQITQLIEFIRQNTGVWAQEGGESAVQDLQAQISQRHAKLQPYFEGLTRVLEAVYRKVLRIYRTYADEIVTLKPGSDGYHYKQTLRPAQQIPEKPMVLVRFDDKSDSQKMQIVVGGFNAVEKGVMSVKELLERAGTMNVSEELAHIRSDQAMRSQSAQELMAPLYHYRRLKVELRDAEKRGDAMEVGIIRNQLNMLIAQTNPANAVAPTGPTPAPAAPPLGPMPPGQSTAPQAPGGEFSPPPGVPSPVLPQQGFAPGIEQLGTAMMGMPPGTMPGGMPMGMP